VATDRQPFLGFFPLTFQRKEVWPDQESGRGAHFVPFVTYATARLQRRATRDDSRSALDPRSLASGLGL
jgi:hypothetical protein